MNFPSSALIHMKTRVCLQYFVRDCDIMKISPVYIKILTCPRENKSQLVAGMAFRNPSENNVLFKPCINPFFSNAPFLYPFKTSENLKFL